MLTDAEIRDLAIDTLTQRTARDAQRRIGASDLSDPCDFCLAAKLLGQSRETALSNKTWLGRTMGTAVHGLLEQRLSESNTIANTDGAEVETHVWFADLGSYGKVGGSIDLSLPEQLVDWKGSTRKKTALMQDYLQSLGEYRRGLPSRWTQQARGNWKLEFSDCSYSLSDKDYQHEMAKQVTKVTGYYGQLTLYMKGSGRRRASIVFVNRDGTGFFDVPSEDGYNDPAKRHDVWVLSFDYNPEYAEALISRGTNIWNMLQSGSTVADFARHEHCFACSKELEDARRTAMPDIEVELGVVM